jgi:uncharacterized protein YndB with AHSA1/START domain
MPSSGALEVTTPTDRELVLIRTIRATPEQNFDALVTPDILQRWMLGPPGMTMPVCEVDLRVGGGFRIVWQMPDGNTMGMRGTYRELDRPHRLVHTELFDQDWTGGETLITTVLTGEDGRTRLNTTDCYNSKQTRDGARATGMEKGIAMSYDRLDGLLAAGALS